LFGYRQGWGFVWVPAGVGIFLGTGRSGDLFWYRQEWGFVWVPAGVGICLGTGRSGDLFGYRQEWGFVSERLWRTQRPVHLLVLFGTLAVIHSVLLLSPSARSQTRRAH